MRITSIDIETTGIHAHESQMLQIGAVVFDTLDPTFIPRATFNRYVWHDKIKGEHFAIQMNAHIIKRIYDMQQAKRKCKQLQQKIDTSREVEKHIDLNIIEFSYSSLILSKDEEQRIGEEITSLTHESQELLTEDEIAKSFSDFLYQSSAFYKDSKDKEHLNITGKNYWGFDSRFLELLPEWSKLIHPHRRSFDPGNLYAFPDDDVLPSLQECKQRAIEQIEQYKITECKDLFASDVVTHDAVDDAMDVAKLVWFAIKRDNVLRTCAAHVLFPPKTK